nr:unnamed protein product [Digitaria exilis]
MVEPPLDELYVEALWGGGVAAAAEQEEDVRPVGEEVGEWDGWREAARLWRGSGGGGGGAACEVG